MSRLKTSLPESLATTVKSTIADWQSGGKMKRLWDRDASLWTGEDESKWLGWLDIVEEQIAQHDTLQKFAKEVHARGFEHILLLGMGGSSLCPEVLRMTFGRIPQFPTLHVLDSTDPAQVKAFEHQIDIAKTLFIVSSKSGSTLEPNIFKQYFFERTKQVVGADKVGSHFVAVTDPGSKMQEVAEHDHFLHVFFGRPSIGGRYSALSNFGMAPGAAMGLDTKKFLDRAAEMVRACGAGVSVENNTGAVLGIILGSAANAGRDKVTIIASPGISDLGAWLEQLLAESTGKIGKGIIPVDREELAAPEVYGNDRVFAYVRLESGGDADQDAKVAAIEKAGHPVIRIAMPDIYDLGAEFFRWEIATAVAGSIIGINAFNQPDVEASKIATRNLTNEYEKTGSLPAEKPILEDSGVKLFTDEKNAAELAKNASEKSLVGYIKAHL
ncbi:MAG: transaldolase, partial [Candidatus Sulfotelmatobacter sp.]